MANDTLKTQVAELRSTVEAQGQQIAALVEVLTAQAASSTGKSGGKKRRGRPATPPGTATFMRVDPGSRDGYVELRFFQDAEMTEPGKPTDALLAEVKASFGFIAKDRPGLAKAAGRYCGFAGARDGDPRWWGPRDCLTKALAAEVDRVEAAQNE